MKRAERVQGALDYIASNDSGELRAVLTRTHFAALVLVDYIEELEDYSTALQQMVSEQLETQDAEGPAKT